MKNLYKKIVDTIPVFFFLWSRDKKETIYISEKFYDQRSNNYFAPEKAREDLRQFIHNDSQGDYDQFFAGLSKSNNYNDDIELRANENLPNIEWVKLSTFPVLEKESEIKYIAGHISDITHLKEYSALLESQVESLDTVAFMLAHELSSPIANIMGLAQLLKANEGQEDHQNNTELYDYIYRYGGEVMTLTRGIVSLLELQAEQNNIVKEVVPLKPLIQELVNSLYMNTENFGVKISYEKIKEDTHIEVNPVRFVQSLEELMLMFSKHIDNHGEISIISHHSNSKDELELHLVSQDTKLPDKMIKRILDQSSRLNMLDVRGGKIRGLLELIIAKEIIELHRGSISFIHNENEQGFAIHLPV